MKKWMAAILAWAALVPAALAVDALMEGGKSPDGKHEVRIHDLADNDLYYAIKIRGTGPKAKSVTLPGIGGWMKYAGAVQTDRALWHPSSFAVAISDRGSKDSQELQLWAWADGRFIRLELPGFEDNALGRVNAMYVDKISRITPVKWEGDDLHLEYYFTANNRISYLFTVVLHLEHERDSSPRIEFKSIAKLREGEGC